MRMAIERFEDIESWKLGRVISGHVDEMTRNSGLKNDFPLRDQMSRSAGSIMDNIAEGFDAGGNKEFVRFLWYAKRSATELRSQLYRALDRQYCSPDKFDEIYALARQAKSKVAALIRYLKKSGPDADEP